MLSGEDVCSGTSTTGTGTLTLAACPVTVGAIDHDIYLKGAGFVSGNAVLIPYQIIEYTNSSLTTPKTVEKGIGTLTLGAAITNATLARTTVQVVSNPNGASYDDSVPSAFSIGTAANTLVMLGAAAADIVKVAPYWDTALGDAVGFPIPNCGNVSILSTRGALNNDGTGSDWYWEILLLRPILVKRATVRVGTAYSGGTPVSKAFFRIYGVGTNGRPGKLMIDLDALGGANPLNSTGNITTALHSTGIWLPPGLYFANLFATFTGGVTPPVLYGSANMVSTGVMGTSGGVPTTITFATGGSSTASDPANTTSYAISGMQATSACGNLYVTLNNA